MTQVPYHNKNVAVTKIFTFDSAHRLDDYIGKCSNLHGHTYKLEVTIKGQTDHRGIVVDFGDIKSIVNEQIIGKYDHRFLNDLMDFNTTAENMVVHFFAIIDTYLQQLDNPTPAHLLKCRLWETPSCYAEVTREDFYAAE